MLWIGLTGGIAAGKSLASSLLRKQGIPVIDADELAKQAVQPGTSAYRQILSHFGPDFLREDQSLDRGRLGDVVFRDPNELRFLESVIHPFVQKEVGLIRSNLEAAGQAFAVYDVPLLFEKNLQDQFDRIVVVGCSIEHQINRLHSRNRLSRDQALERIRSQMDLKSKMEKADDVLWNEGSPTELELQVNLLVQKLRNESSKA